MDIETDLPTAGGTIKDFRPWVFLSARATVMGTPVEEVVMSFTDERTGNEVIPLAQCVHRLEAKEVARIAFTRGQRVHLYPINYAWDGEAIVFRCSAESPIADSVNQEVVIEVDHIDEREHFAWSVIARGVPELVDPEQTPELMRRLRSLSLYPWAEGEKGVWIRMIPSPLTGRVVKRTTRK
ncbi:MAG: pyridoxamine 5'-phosphate oxidase family protein [Acidimicrobiia bacterium]|nr:pyridoxamine 5'-phosphate oxidase family protein [Acidimicrobiia bacterium]